MNQDDYYRNASNEHFQKQQEEYYRKNAAMIEQMNANRRANRCELDVQENGKRVDFGAMATARWLKLVWRWKRRGFFRKLSQWMLILFLFVLQLVLGTLENLFVFLYYATR